MQGPLTSWNRLSGPVSNVRRHVSKERGMHACMLTLVLLPASVNPLLISPHELIFPAWGLQGTY